MVRIYRLCECVDLHYHCIGYYLDPSTAADLALKRSKVVKRGDYLIVSQIDVYPNEHVTNEFLRVDGLA